MAEVFLSYSKIDREVVDRLEAALTEMGLSIWRDTALRAGDDFRREIDAQLDRARAVVACCSSASLASEQVLDEVEYAKRQQKPILAVALEAPQSLKLPTPLVRVNLADLSGWNGTITEAAFLKLLTSIGHAIGRAEDLGRHEADWLEEQRLLETDAALKRQAEEVAAATRERIALESQANAKRARETALSRFREEQRQQWKALDVVKLAESARSRLSATTTERLAAESNLTRAMETKVLRWNIPSVTFSGEPLRAGCGYFCLLGVAVGVFAVFVSPASGAMLLLMYGIPAYLLLGPRPIISFQSKRGLREQVERATKREAEARQAFTVAETRANAAWEPFESAIAQFERNLPD